MWRIVWASLLENSAIALVERSRFGKLQRLDTRCRGCERTVELEPLAGSAVAEVSFVEV